MLASLCVLLLNASPIAQDLANAERQLASVRKTREATGALEEEVASLGDAWLREEAAATTGLNTEARVARYVVLLSEARRRALPATEAFLEGQAKGSLVAWLGQCDELLGQGQPVRALAWRRRLVTSLPPESPLRALRGDVESKALQGLRRAAGPYETFALRAVESLTRAEAVALPNDLATLRFPEAAPVVTSQCAQATPVLAGRPGGVLGEATLALSTCTTSTSDAVVTRQAKYQVTELVPTPETYKVTELQMRDVAETQTTCAADCYDQYRNRGPCTTCPPNMSVTATVFVRREVPVEVERVRMVDVPTVVTKYEPYQVTVRTFTARVEATAAVSGDGQSASRRDVLTRSVTEEQYASEHGGSLKFTGQGERRALELLPEPVAGAFADALLAWDVLRGQALLEKATSLEGFMTAAVLTRAVSPRLAQALQRDLGLTTSETAVLVEPHRAVLELPPAARGPLPTLPPPDEDLSRRLATYENKVEVVESQGGYFGGLDLGLAALEANDRGGERALGFGASATFGFRPVLSVKSPLFLRVMLTPSVSAVGHFHVTALARAEVGVQWRSFVLAAVGAGHFQWTLFTDDNLAAPTYASDARFSTPTAFSAGYGAFLRLPFFGFEVHPEGAKPYTVTPGLELLLIRLHRNTPSSPLGARAEARLFFDLGQVARFTAGLVVDAQDDVAQVLGGRSRQAIASLGLHSDF